ncbi:hypothetical protein [Abyssicoccus albus]|uniref:Uncharacterized protein n=1 Tax=Abyssicoccus albus TaxID=1817405 RepID=A0A3N5BYA3_9BACL|nr:hypothetical protein [Abyssicoccus albus]RPF54788.1 hypothetical protein EDD62_1749 [Abyssicoccus albus]
MKDSRLKKFVLGLLLLIGAPIIVPYRIAEMHFVSKTHWLVSVAEWVNATKVMFEESITGKENAENLFNENEIDWWFRTGRYIKKYSGLSYGEISEFRNEMNWFRFAKSSHMDYADFSNEGKAISLIMDVGEKTSYVVFREDRTYEIKVAEHKTEELKGIVDDSFIETIKNWRNNHEK